jgi:hypothetical protein
MVSYPRSFFLLQTKLLQMMGFLPSGCDQSAVPLLSRGRILQTSLSCFAATLLIGTTVCNCLRGAKIIYGVILPVSVGKYQGTTALLDILEMIPFFTKDLRSLIVLTVFFVKRNSLKNLLVESYDLVDSCFPNQQSKQLLFRKIKRKSVIFFILSLGFHILWESLGWLDYFTGGHNRNLWSEDIIAPFLKEIYAWQFLIIDSFFSTFPFFLSQQVFLCAIILVVILSEAFQILERELMHETMSYRLQEGSFVTRETRKRTLIKLKSWERNHLFLLAFTKSVNDFFALIFLTVYGLDVLTMFSFASWTVTSGSKSPSVYAFAMGSVLLFGSYATILPIPMVQVHEMVG